MHESEVRTRNRPAWRQLVRLMAALLFLSPFLLGQANPEGGQGFFATCAENNRLAAERRENERRELTRHCNEIALICAENPDCRPDPRCEGPGGSAPVVEPEPEPEPEPEAPVEVRSPCDSPRPRNPPAGTTRVPPPRYASSPGYVWVPDQYTCRSSTGWRWSRGHWRRARRGEASHQVKGKVTFYEHCNYKGWGVTVPPGSHSLNSLERMGFKNDRASSVRVGRGRSVQMYQHNGHSGTSKTARSDVACLTSLDMNDKISSVIVK